ncbi:hypothetical protein M011DRAFT_472420 [Sporormia fimetaria CBS 119925]|uniref:Uncharacterized protein n=1 Tax=Sporormia fimetaria CBS 119925 TaxID=1340428 RepID=A0A6A6UVM2_9PLEO|nr:hypothetical protein M011DRAFT_472420 [Sporormia fimetaria CBS 119925]
MATLLCLHGVSLLPLQSRSSLPSLNGTTDIFVLAVPRLSVPRPAFNGQYKCILHLSLLASLLYLTMPVTAYRSAIGICPASDCLITQSIPSYTAQYS